MSSSRWGARYSAQVWPRSCRQDDLLSVALLRRDGQTNANSKARSGGPQTDGRSGRRSFGRPQCLSVRIASRRAPPRPPCFGGWRRARALAEDKAMDDLHPCETWHRPTPMFSSAGVEKRDLIPEEGPCKSSECRRMVANIVPSTSPNLAESGLNFAELPAERSQSRGSSTEFEKIRLRPTEFSQFGPTLACNRPNFTKSEENRADFAPSSTSVVQIQPGPTKFGSISPELGPWAWAEVV